MYSNINTFGVIDMLMCLKTVTESIRLSVVRVSLTFQHVYLYGYKCLNVFDKRNETAYFIGKRTTLVFRVYGNNDVINII